MNRKSIVIYVILAVVIVVGLSIVILLNINNNKDSNKVDNDYFAVFSNGVPDFCFYSIFLYIDNSQARYIATVTPTTIDGKNGDTKIIKEGNLTYPQDVFDLEIKYSNIVTIKADGHITINKNVERYKKGDSITAEDLYNLIAIK